VDVEGREGQTVLQAALDAGIHIPHFCFHPNLKVAGNCRMCLVEIEKVPKLQIACGTPIREGMVVTTKNERVKKAREAVLEFLLINHPLDCPICDQCGECKLQDYCFQYGKDKSRFSEKKHTFPLMDLGPDITRNQNRCIHCTRCIRVMRDVAGSEALGLSERSGRTVVGPYMDTAIASRFSMNAADVCPVGALTSKHFRFKARSWLMEQTRTICTGCARGCNVTAWVYKGEVLRLTPAENEKVNRTWLCNMGRLSISEIAAKSRIRTARVKGKEVVPEEAVSRVAKALLEADGKAAIVASTRLSNEDAYAVKTLAQSMGAGMVALVGGAKDDRPFGPIDAPLTDWFIREDGTPNARGTREVLGDTKEAYHVIEAVGAGEITTILLFGADLMATAEGAKAALEKADFVAVADVHENETTKLADVVLPAVSPFERDGTFTNEGGRVQRAVTAVPPIGESRAPWQWASALMEQLGKKVSFQSAEAILDKIASEVPDYKGLSLYGIPETGVKVGAEEAKPVEDTESEPEEKAD